MFCGEWSEEAEGMDKLLVNRLEFAPVEFGKFCHGEVVRYVPTLA